MICTFGFMKFYALDVETANPDQFSICQIGIVVFENGRVVDTWSSYIDPQSYFHWAFIRVHGITEEMVKGQPTFARVYPKLRRLLENNIVVHHSPFDKVAFHKAFDRFYLEPFHARWLDSVKVASKAFGNGTLEGGYNLANLANYLDIDFKHHDALEDAIACGKVVVHASRRMGVEVGQLHHMI